MSLKKKISIKPIHLMIGGKESKKKERKKNKKTLESLFKPNKVKRELLEKIKKHQQEKKNLNNKTKDKTPDFIDSFQNSLLYLNKVSENIKKSKHKTLKNKNTLHETKKPPPYGCLKNGTKPTYREYNKTIKNKDGIVSNRPKIYFDLDNEEPSTKPLFVRERQEKLKEIKQTINPLGEKPIEKKRNFKRTKTLKRKILLGKNKGKISVLIKNRKTRKKIRNDTLKLKKKSLREIKQYLRIHNLIKIGTDAPEDVLRETFENALMSGNIYNKNSENMIHNYINQD